GSVCAPRKDLPMPRFRLPQWLRGRRNPRRERAEQHTQRVRTSLTRPRLEQMESREAPQWALPALGAVGASFAAVAAQMFAQPAAGAEYVDVRIASSIETADSSKIIESRAAETRFIIGTDISTGEPWNDGFLPSLGTFDSDLAVRGAMPASAGGLIAAASFPGDPFSEVGGSIGERPFDGGITSLPGELDSGGGGDGPIATSKAPPAAASSPSPTNPTQPAPS